MKGKVTKYYFYVWANKDSGSLHNEVTKVKGGDFTDHPMYYVVSQGHTLVNIFRIDRERYKALERHIG